MSSEYFQGMDVSEKLWHVASNPNAASFSYQRLAVCRKAAETQMRRIWEAVTIAQSAAREPSREAALSELRAFLAEAQQRHVPLLHETHFYFVAWANCGNMLRVLTGLPEFLEAKKVFDSHKRHFEHYTAARNSFEHYHDRLPGKPDEKKVREVIQEVGTGPSRIYYGFEGGNYKHSDMTWDITPKSLTLLQGLIDEVLSVLHRQIEELFQAKFSRGAEKGSRNH